MKNNYVLQRPICATIFRSIMVAVFVLEILVSTVFGQQIILNTGAYLNNSGAAYIVINNGAFVNNGNYTKGAETVTFSGTAARAISGSSNTDLYNLSITNTGGITAQVGELTVNALTVASGCKLTINPAKAVTASGALTNSAGTGGLILKSDVTGTASLIHNTTSVPATMQRYISGAAEAWHFLSSPVAAQSIGGDWLPSGTYGNGTGYDLYVWNEPNSCWIYQLDITSTINWNTVHPGSDFVVGRGYLYSVQVLNPTKEFVGNLNNGSLNYGHTIGSSDVSLKGFNLVGNPYPSSIDWQAASGWIRSNLVSSAGGYDMWIWNPTVSNYGVCNSFTGAVTNGVTRYIAPMQGFFVQATSAGNLSMDNAVRVQNGASAWLKSKKMEDANVSVVIQSEADIGSDEILLSFGYAENENGAMKLFSKVLSAPNLYMASERNYYSVRYFSTTDENPAVPIMFKPGAAGSYTIGCNFDLSKFETVLLHDRKTEYMHDMKALNTYSFQSSTSDAANRFVLYFGPVENYSDDGFPARIYTDGIQLVVDLTLISSETEVTVYDVLGRLLLQKTLQGLSERKLWVNAKSQIIIVHLKSKQGTMCRKLFYN